MRTVKRRVMFAALLALSIAAAFSAGPLYGLLRGAGLRAVPLSAQSVPCGGLSADQAQTVSAATPWYCPINNQIYDAWQGSVDYALLAVLLAFAVAGLIFMIGVAAKSEKIRTFGMGELYEAIASAIIVVLFVYICAVLFGLVPSFVVGPVNPYATAFNLMVSTMQQAETMYNSLYIPDVVDSFYASTSVTIQVQTITGGTPALSPPVRLFRPIYAATLQLLVLGPILALTNFISDALVIIYSEYYMLVFFSVAAIPAFLVPGVIFRAVLPTRALGGILIALAMGVYLVMPTLFAVAYYFTAPTALQQLTTVNLLLNRYAAGSGAITNAVTPTSPLVLQLQNVNNAMSGFWLLILFYPMLIIAMTYAFVSQIANFIGGAYRAASSMRKFI